VPFGGGITDKWIESLNALLNIPADVVVPGHGEVEFTKNSIKTERDLLQSLMTQAILAVQKGESLDDFKKSVDVSKFKKELVGTDSELSFGWDNYFLSTELDRVYAIAEGDY
jgi:glyoxylase-like metal-dependent hydrolase (beta-lactamase superfamily II)